MMFNEIKSGDIPCLSFLKGTDYAMYIGPDLSPMQREQLKSKDIPVPVIYLPEILEQLSDDVIKYNFPGVTMPESLTVESIYAQIRAEFNGRITPESRLIVKYNGDVLVIYDAKDCFSLAISYLINMCAPQRPRARKMMKISWKMSKVGLEDLFDALDDEKEDIRFSTRPRREVDSDICYSIQEKALISEEGFDDEMQKAFHDAEDIIKTLLLKGCPPELLLTLINQSVKLSRIRITKQFKIFLTDYDNEEIKMGPLPKTVFLFYLRHPEGVMFSHLQNYRDELLRIYGHVCTNDDPQRMEDSIDRLINPFDNSICEKCANVKKAFILKIADNIASNYYISGEQGEKKTIPLDRNLVEWECKL